MNRWQMMYENERNKNSQAARNLFSRSCCAKEREKERRERGMLHFHLELPLPHNHPPLGPSTKISKVSEYPFTWDGGGDLMVYNPSGYITSNSGIFAAWSFEMRREEVGESCGRTAGREGETGSVKIRRSRGSTKEGRGEEERRVEREDRKKEEKESEGEKGRATSARSRATIGDHLPSSAVLLVVLDLSRRRQRGRKEYDKALRRRHYQIIHSHRALSIFEATRS